MKCILSRFTPLLVCLLLAACATPASPSQALAYAYGTVASARIATSNALAAGTISVATAQTILTDTDLARSALDAGEALIVAGSTDSGSIAQDIATATSILQTVQSLLPVSAAPTLTPTAPTSAAPVTP